MHIHEYQGCYAAFPMTTDAETYSVPTPSHQPRLPLPPFAPSLTPSVHADESSESPKIKIKPEIMHLVLSQRRVKGFVVSLGDEPVIALPNVGAFHFVYRSVKKDMASKLKVGCRVDFRLSQAHPPRAVSIRLLGDAPPGGLPNDILSLIAKYSTSSEATVRTADSSSCSESSADMSRSHSLRSEETEHQIPTRRPSVEDGILPSHSPFPPTVASGPTRGDAVPQDLVLLQRELEVFFTGGNLDPTFLALFSEVLPEDYEGGPLLSLMQVVEENPHLLTLTSGDQHDKMTAFYVLNEMVRKARFPLQTVPLKPTAAAVALSSAAAQQFVIPESEVKTLTLSDFLSAISLTQAICEVVHEEALELISKALGGKRTFRPLLPGSP